MAGKSKEKKVKAAKFSKKLNLQKFNFKKLPLKKRDVIILSVLVVAAILTYMFKGLVLAATVNGKPVWRTSVISELEKTQGSQVLENLVIEQLIKQEASKKGITVAEQDIDDQLKGYDDQLKAQGQSLDQALSLQGMTREDLKGRLRVQMLAEKLIGDDASVSDDEVNKYIEDNKGLFPEGTSDDEKKSGALAQLKQQKLTEGFQSLITKLKGDSSIKYFVNY